MTAACVIVLSGHSGSGKTTLIEKVLPALKKEGFSVGILKHAHHRLDFDVKGKDTDKFHKAGADFVFAHDSTQGFARYKKQYCDLGHALEEFPIGLDLIIIEGHKNSTGLRVWLKTRKEELVRKKDITLILDRSDPGCLRKFIEFIYRELDTAQLRRAIAAGLLIGGKSRRMGRAKSLLRMGGKTLIERNCELLSEMSDGVVLLGAGTVPLSMTGAKTLPDIHGISGPMAGMLSAFRWAPERTWIISAVDMPLMSKEAWQWLLKQRSPGVWAVMPRVRGKRTVEPTGAVYEPMIFSYIESIARKGILSVQDIAKHPKVFSPEIPEALAPAWQNINTPEEWQKTLSSVKGKKR